MLNKVLEEAAKKEAKEGNVFDAILLIGDLICHGLAAYPPNPPTNWQLQQETMTAVMAAITNYFPGIPILPVIGNNDVMYHNLAPSATDAPAYYSTMWDIFVTNVPANLASFT